MDIFPCEIWEEVVKYLAAYDLINFCKSSDAFPYLLREKNVVMNFDLGGCFDIYKEQLYKYIYQEIGYEHIKSLNINKLYWIGLEEIRDILRLLPHLEELRALDTILGARNDDIVLYKKLKKLAISVEADHFTSSRQVYRENLAQLRSLCIKFVSKYRADFRRIYYFFFHELRKLDELWIFDADDVEPYSLRYDYIVCILRCLKKLVIKSKINLILLDYKPFGLLKVFERRTNNTTTICYVKYDPHQWKIMRKGSISEVFESTTEKSWNVIQSFLTETPCNLQTSIDVARTKTIKNTEFKALSLYHTRTCNRIFVNSVINLLLSKRCRNLKKLSLTLCILQGNIEIRVINSLIFRKFNILQGNVEQNEKKNVFKHIINNCQYLTDLELVTCTNSEATELDAEGIKQPCYSSAVIGAYALISNLRYLKNLTLDIPSYSNATFLKDVFLKCPDLEGLNIISREVNEDLNAILYSNLNYTQTLRDFRFETVHVDLDRLFSALNKAISLKLKRVVVKCDYESSTQFWPLEKLISHNRNIIFLVILVSTYHRHQINKLQDLLDNYKDHPAKIYVANTAMTPEEDIVIPEAHKDILYFNTDVSVLHLSDF